MVFVSAGIIGFFVVFLQFNWTLMEFTCGKKPESSELIIGGTHSGRGQWPWLVALVYTKSQKYFCEATLISSKHTVTGAHCIQPKKSQTRLKPDELVALLGILDTFKRNEKESKARFIIQIVLHPDYKFDDLRYDANIAIIVFRNPVDFSESIQPICLPTARVTMPIENGVIAGWEKLKSSTQRQNFPKHEYVRAKNNDLCFLDNNILGNVASNRTFCVETRSCIGDSGGGFFVNKGKLWILQGVASPGSWVNKVCTTETLAVYTNIKHFALWIKNTAEGAGLTQAIKLVNFYIYENYDGIERYTCEVDKLSNTSENAEIRRAFGIHVHGKSNDNVEVFVMRSEKESTHLPNGIGRNYPNLIILQIEFCRLKFIRRSNFKEMTKLTIISLQANEITDFPEDTLWDLKDVKKVDLSRNNLISLHPDTFIHLSKLETLNLHYNSIEYLDGRLFMKNSNIKIATFQSNKITVIGIDFSELNNIQEINLRGNFCINMRFPEETLARLLQEISANCAEFLRLNFAKSN